MLTLLVAKIPAAIVPEYKNGQYETKESYQKRLLEDFKHSSQTIFNHIGKKPRIIVWPYGQFNDIAVETAKQTDMPYHFL